MVHAMKIVDLKKDMDARFAQVDARFAQIDQRITTEHETTRRYMDMLFEQFKAENRLGLEKIAALEQQSNSFQTSNIFEHAAFVEILQNHEGRIKALEPGDEFST
jgi:uncharacterized protein YdcH (DUF465 family)